jgi:dCTP deaminase
MFVHVTAGFGDVGFCGYWTLEMIAIQPIRVYPAVQVCQIFYHTVEGAITEYRTGKYQGNQDIQPSFLFRELTGQPDRQRTLNFDQRSIQADSDAGSAAIGAAGSL